MWKSLEAFSLSQHCAGVHVCSLLTIQSMRAQVKQVCSLVSVRSARLIAAAICGILAHLQRDRPRQEGQPPPRNCIAVDGGVLVRYKFYRELLVQGVREILGDAVADQVRTPAPRQSAGNPYQQTSSKCRPANP